MLHCRLDFGDSVLDASLLTQLKALEKSIGAVTHGPVVTHAAQRLDHLQRAVEETTVTQRYGKLAHANGTLLKATGLKAKIGELCELSDPESDWNLQAEVVGIAADHTLLTPMGSLQGVSSETRVRATGEVPYVQVGHELLGRVLNASGLPLDDGRPIAGGERVPLHQPAPDPMSRRPVCTPFTTGVRAIDSLCTTGTGQRMGIFATAGGGKSTLLGMLARGSRADVNVVALIGERGREVGEFVRHNLGDSLKNSVVVVATSDRPPLERARALYMATAIADYFREQGGNVLFLADSITRFARALRDIGLAAGEPPTRRGFTPSVFSELPRALERTGNSKRGSITAFYTVLMEDEDSADPIAEEVRSILDGHLILSSALAAAQHYPAIDIPASTSRLMSDLVDDAHGGAAATARRLLARREQIELLVQMGEYQPGQDAEADHALAVAEKLKAHLCQASDERIPFADSTRSLNVAVTM